VRYVAHECGPSLQSDLGHWIDASPRFASFVAANQDKIRKKLSTAAGSEGRLDVRAELHVAHVLLADRRFEVAFEAYGSHQAGPDLTVTYRANQRFNLEVTRPHAGPDVSRLAGLIAAKLRQLPVELPNALVIAGDGLSITAAQLSDAWRLLKTRVDSRDDAFFGRRGLIDARSAHLQLLRLSGVFVLDEADAPIFWANPEARHPLPSEVVHLLRAHD